jgi:hypothetical protein
MSDMTFGRRGPIDHSVAPPFSLTRGGPTHRLGVALARAHWVRMSCVAIAVTWVPIIVLSIVEWRATGKLPSLVVSYSLHAKLLVAIPVLFAAEPVLHMRTCRCVDRIVDERWVEPLSEVLALTTAAERRRDSTFAEVLLLGLAVMTSQALLWGLLQPLGVERGRGLANTTAAAVWNGAVALSVYQFLLYRWLWRWVIWSRLLWGLSHLKVRALATHPDKQGGLGFLAESSAGFAVVIFAISAVQASVWADKVSFAHASVMSFKSEIAALLALVFVLALGPLAFFVRPLWLARFQAVREYGRLAADHARLFHARWVERGEREGLLGSPDVSSLADMGTSYDVIRLMRPFPFSLYTILIIVLAVLVPMIPLALMEVPLVELLGKLSGVAMGGLPH